MLPAESSMGRSPSRNRGGFPGRASATGMMKRSPQKPKGHLEGLLKWVLAMLILVNLLFFLPTQVSSIRLDLLHPSLPAVPLDRLRLTNSPFLRKLFLQVKNGGINQSHTQPSIWVGPTAMPTEGFATDIFSTPTRTPVLPLTDPSLANSATGGPTTAPTHTPTARPTSMSMDTPSPTLPPTPPVPSATLASMKNYYVAPDGDDTNPGTIDRPWRTHARVQAAKLLPGDVVRFQRGGTWSGGLTIDDSGVQGNPITFTSYGDGDRPVFTNPGGAGGYTRVISVNADWVIIEGFFVQDAHEAGVYVSSGSDHNAIRDIEATNTGFGISIRGRFNLVTGNYLHDLHMVFNTPGGNDDYGAIGIEISNGSDNEVSYNRMVKCKASSYDYGSDGGAVELFGVADRNYIHHNWATASDGFIEVSGGSARDTIVAYNVSVNNGGFSWIHLSGPFAGDVQDFRIENNTVVETETENQGWVVFGFRGDPTPNMFRLINNIVWVERGSGDGGGLKMVANSADIRHENNLFHLVGEVELGFDLGKGEAMGDPLFVNLQRGDFHLQAGSMAIDSGLDLGYSRDFDDRKVPSGQAPDMGAFEYRP